MAVTLLLQSAAHILQNQNIIKVFEHLGIGNREASLLLQIFII